MGRKGQGFLESALKMVRRLIPYVLKLNYKNQYQIGF